MRDDKDHNERLDDFSGYMRQRLEEHRLPVDAGCWDEVEARMNRKARDVYKRQVYMFVAATKMEICF